MFEEVQQVRSKPKGLSAWMIMLCGLGPDVDSAYWLETQKPRGGYC